MTHEVVLHILKLNMTSESNLDSSAVQTVGNQTALQLSLNFIEVSKRS